MANISSMVGEQTKAFFISLEWFQTRKPFLSYKKKVKFYSIKLIFRQKCKKNYVFLFLLNCNLSNKQNTHIKTHHKKNNCFIINFTIY